MPERLETWRDPEAWLDRRRSYREYNKIALDDYARFCQWFAGDLTGVNKVVGQMLGEPYVGPLANHININTRASIAELMFRAPRFHVSNPVNYGPGVFSPELATIETMLANDWVEEVDLYGEGRMCLLDGLLGPIMVLKVGYAQDIGIDDELMETERRHAISENNAILAGGHPKVDKDDYHPGHIDEHEAALALIERGDQAAPASVIRYLKKHIKFHRDAATLDGGRELETVRNCSVFAERVSPTCFAYDPFSSRAARRGWVIEAFLKPIDEVKADRRYDAAARKQVTEANYDEVGSDVAKKAERAQIGSEYEGDAMALIYEGIDLRKGKLVTFAQGCEKMLREVDYDDKDIAPSGPYITASFAQDPANDCGVAPPRIYEAHQIMVSYLSAIIAITAKRSIPAMAAVGGKFKPADLEKLRSGSIARLYELKDFQPGDDLKQLIQPIPVPEASEFLFAAKQDHERGAERYSGLGSARSGGGDFSKTATASAIVNESGNGMSEDQASIVDDFMSRAGRLALRHMRKRYRPAKVAEIVGEKALGVWPERWSIRDIVRDKGVMVVPGSSKRKNTAVEQKLGLELLAIVQKFPNTPPTLIVELFRRVTEASGMFALDLGEMEQQAKIAEIQQLFSAMSGGQPQEPVQGGQSPVQRRASSRSGATPSDQIGGVNNVGGGRLPTGAGNGDKPRLVR